jgi:predicted amidohydrolase
MSSGRQVTLSAVCFELPEPGEGPAGITKAGNLEKALGMLAEAGRRGSDLVVLPEVFATKHTGLSAAEAAEVVPEGEISRALAGAAREHGMYVAGSLYERKGDGVYNTVALFDRRGEVVGRYHKVHLPPEEASGVKPGDGYPAFDADFGKVGAVVCFDLNFPEAVRCLALAGAEVVVWPTMYSEPRAHYTDVLMRARAIENKVFLVAANYTQRGRDPRSVHIGRSAIVDWDGMVLAETGRREGVATATVDLKEPRDVFGWPEELMAMRRPETYGRLVEGAE